MTLRRHDPTGRPSSIHSHRGHQRGRNHESAHAEVADAGADIPDHPLIPRSSAELVTTDNALAELIQHLRAEGQFAYDSEFIGELTYIPKLCLIQVASSQRIALIDPIADIDLTPFWELLCDPSVEKIVHAGQQDMEPVMRHLGREPANLFDTQVAAGFIGLAYPVALSKLVHEMVGAKLGKSLTFSHWDQRPLSAMQLRYAADDVRYLPALRAELGRRLEAAGHTAWAADESASMCAQPEHRSDPKLQYLRVRGAGSLTPQGLAILRELTIWRDATARAHDVPPRGFLKDEILIAMARNPVKSVDKLDRVRGLPRPIEEQHGAEIVQATLRAIAMPASSYPEVRTTEQTPTERFRTDALWAIVQCLCIGRSIDPDLVTSRQEITEIYPYLTGEQSGDVRLLTGWRREAVGQPLIDLIQGKGAVKLEWVNDALRATVTE